MANSSNSSNSSNNLSLVQPGEKLMKTNHTLWYAQVRSALRGAKLMGYLTGDTKAPSTHIPAIGADGK
jgi:hypothetical protein